METIKDKPAVRLKPSSYQPSKAEMEEDIGIDTTPEDLLRAVVCDVRIDTTKIPDRSRGYSSL